MKNINEMMVKENISEYEKEFLTSLKSEANAIEAFNGMKATDGWKLLATKIREELSLRIADSIKDNDRIQVLLGILSTVETKEASKLLEEEINRVIPN